MLNGPAPEESVLHTLSVPLDPLLNQD